MTVTFYGRITEYTGGDKTYTPVPGGAALEGSTTLRALLDELCSHYGERFESLINGSETCLILLNGNGVALTGGPDSPIGPEDRVDILPFVDAG